MAKRRRKPRPDNGSSKALEAKARQEPEAPPNEGARPEAEEGPSVAGDAFVLDTAQRWPTVVRLKKSAFEPVPINELSLRNELAPMVAVFAFAIMLYGITAPRFVTLEDDGLFLMLLHHFGVGHPPGYPLYSLLGTPFYKLMPDFFSPAFKGHMFSGFAGAVACTAVYLITAMLVRSRLCALAAGIGYAASEAFWSQAIIAEVYTLNAAMYFIVMAMCVRYAAHRGEPTKEHLVLYCAVAFTYGLALSNHWPLVGLGSIGLLLVVMSQWRGILRRSPLGVVFLAVGLLPYAWLIWRSHSDTMVNFYGPIEDLKALWFYVTRSGYSGVDNQEGVGLPEKLTFTVFFLHQLSRQVTPLGLAIAVLGFFTMLRSPIHSWLAVGLAVAWFMAGPLMIILIDFQTEFIWFSAFRVYHLLCYGITLIWFGYGLAWMGSWLSKRLRGELRAGAAVAGASAVVVALTLAIEWRQNDRSGYTWANDLALFKLSQVEPNTQLFTFDDLDLPVGYLNLVEGVRPDVRIYNDQGLVFGNRIYSPFVPDTRKTRIIGDYYRENRQVPFYYHPFRVDLFKVNGQGSDFLGFWRRINNDGPDDRIVLSDSLLYWLQDNLDSSHKIVDRWTRQQAAGIIATLITAVVQASQNGYALTPQWEAVIDEAYEKNELVRLFLLWNETFANGVDETRAEEEIGWIESVIPNQDQYIYDNSNMSDLLVVAAQLYINHPELVGGDLEEKVEELLSASLEFEFKFTPYRMLADIYRGDGRHQEALELLEGQFETISKADAEFRNYHNLIDKEIESGETLRPVMDFDEASES